MEAVLSEAEFSKHVNQIFTVHLDEENRVDLELVEVKPYKSNSGDVEGMERFSVYFEGPKPLLPQRTYSLSNEGMGTMELFIVPIGAEGDGFRYEAVFNLYKNA